MLGQKFRRMLFLGQGCSTTEVKMELKISAKNLTISDRFRDYVEDKAGKIDRYAHKPE
jgi:hypothetical protein